MSAWKPGDVALANGAPVTFYKDEATGEVMFTNRYGHQRLARHLTPSARPLVVIDPEDAGEVDRIATSELRLGVESVLRVSIDDRQWERIGERLQAALRSLLAPPKPDEPTGLGAVVEDADGKRWVHRGRGFVTAWARIATTPDEAYGKACGWSDLSAVRVLSEGVAE